MRTEITFVYGGQPNHFDAHLLFDISNGETIFRLPIFSSTVFWVEIKLMCVPKAHVLDTKSTSANTGKLSEQVINSEFREKKHTHTHTHTTNTI